MKRLIVILTFLATLFLPFMAGATQDPSSYFATCLTGGLSNCIDGIDVIHPDQYNVIIVLQDGDVASAITQTAAYSYIYDADSGETEASPYIIKPDYSDGETYTGDGRWIMVSAVSGSNIYELSLQGNYGCDIADAISSIGSTVATLKIDCNTVVGSGETIIIPETLTLSFTSDGLISGVSGGAAETFVVMGGIKADAASRIFGDDLVVDLTEAKLDRVYIDWFGCNPNNIDNVVYLQTAMDSLDNTRVVLLSLIHI